MFSLCFHNALMVYRGEEQPRGDGWRKATIGSAARNGSYQRIYCDDCKHQLVISAVDLLEKFKIPPETPFWTLAQRLVCSKCGSTKVGIMADSWRPERDRQRD
jgi:hypothetical protein